jgi:hypothetical protein
MGILDTSTLQGFGNLDQSDFVITAPGGIIDLSDSLQDALVMRTTQGASTITLQIADPYRTVLQGNLFQWPCTLVVDNLEFSLVEITKEGDTVQFVFEAYNVALLRQFTGVQATSNTTDIAGFIHSLIVQANPNMGLVTQTGGVGTPVAIGRGTSGDTTEDSWTCIQRVVTSAGWRCFEVNGTIFLGSDQFFLDVPSQGTLSEFTQSIQNIDFDYDIGKPIGTATVTGTSADWSYPPGAVVWTLGMGPMDGQPWLVQDCQRDLFNPQMTATLYIPMSPQQVISGLPTEAPF